LELEIFILGSIRFTGLKKNFLLNKESFPLLKMLTLIAERGSWKELRNIPFRRILFLICRFILALRWRKLDFNVKIGTGDAAWTGVLTSFLRQLSEIASYYFFQVLSFKQRPRILIYPSFLQKEFIFSFYVEFYANGMILIYYSTLILWEAVFRGQIQILWRLVRYGRASYTGFDDNGHGKFKGNGRCY
jgi:hypothetical protein